MTPPFQLCGIEPAPFAHLFELSDEALKQHGAVRQFATESPGYPCRVSLQDAEVGEELLLLPYEHQPAASPYRACGPIGRGIFALGEIDPARGIPLGAIPTPGPCGGIPACPGGGNMPARCCCGVGPSVMGLVPRAPL